MEDHTITVTPYGLDVPFLVACACGGLYMPVGAGDVALLIGAHWKARQ